MKGAYIIPLGIADQFTVTENGDQIQKLRITHDCSWEDPSGFSVNNTVLTELLEPCKYEYCLNRILHKIQKMRYDYPLSNILITKHDFDSAYRRLHWRIEIALLCITIIENIVYFLTRLAFGITSGPSEYSMLSDLMADYANILIHDESRNISDLHSPNQKLFGKILYQDASVQIKKSKKLSVPVTSSKASVDGYIDDLVTLVLDEPALRERAENAVPLLVHILFRPVAPDEPTDRDDPLSLRKLKGEGNLSETKTIFRMGNKHSTKESISSQIKSN